MSGNDSSCLAPYSATPGAVWDRRTAAHLLRRAGFAPDEESVQRALSDGLDATVERLLEPGAESGRAAELDALAEATLAGGDVARLREWWLLRMCHTIRPLHARMSLFWHNHFATSQAKVQNTRLMLGQLRLFERHALGHFGDLLRAVSRDPAMIIWLDGAENVKGRPNENYARELFELFTLGVGNYTESDIREAARAFSGWHEKNGRFHFVEYEHDEGEKSVLGQTGAWDGDDIVQIALEHPAAGRFLARKLLQEFVHPAPPEAWTDALATHLRANSYDIAEALSIVLRSRMLFSPQAYRARIKSPVEYAVGIVRSLHLRTPGPALADAVSQMGQRLFEPPTVKGWEGHRRWINSATMLVRMNAAAQALQHTDDGKGFEAAAFAGRYNLNGRDDIVSFCGALLLDGQAPDALLHQAQQLPDASPGETVRSVLLLLLTSPEYQFA